MFSWDKGIVRDDDEPEAEPWPRSDRDDRRRIKGGQASGDAKYQNDLVDEEPETEEEING